MPLYEYQCQECSHRFEMRRSAGDCDAAECEACGSARTKRLLSLFAAYSKGNGGGKSLGGGGCAGCAAGHCATCGRH